VYANRTLTSADLQILRVVFTPSRHKTDNVLLQFVCANYGQSPQTIPDSVQGNMSADKVNSRYYPVIHMRGIFVYNNTGPLT